MNRRKFIQGVFAGIATVAIASKLAPEFPRPASEVFDFGYTITDEEIDEGLYGEIGDRYAKALAKSMVETMEQTAYKVLTA